MNFHRSGGSPLRGLPFAAFAIGVVVLGIGHSVFHAGDDIAVGIVFEVYTKCGGVGPYRVLRKDPPGAQVTLYDSFPRNTARFAKVIVILVLLRLLLLFPEQASNLCF